MNILKQKKLLLTAILLSTVFFSVPLYSQARGLVPCGGYKADGTREAPCNLCDVFSIIALATNWLLSAAGIYAVFQIVNAGFWLITTMGNEESITKWKSALTSAVVGFVLVMMAFLLVNTAVNYLLLGGTTGSKVELNNPFKYLNPTSKFCQVK
jgi:flagellar biosynthesis protein FlhB